MSESSLVTYRVLNTKNVNNRGGKTIKYIIPHCYVGQVTAKRGVDAFNNRNNASVHYVVGYDEGDIGQQVSESLRAWTTGGDKTVRNQYGTFTGRDIDFESVTMEIACDAFYPYAITNGAYANIVNLMADIAKRNGIDLKYTGKTADVGNPELATVLTHNMFASKACPGKDILDKLPQMVADARKVIETGIPYKAPDVKMQAAKPTLRKGNKGAQVKLLQQNLIAIGIALPKYGADSDFGDETKSGVIAFQKQAFPNSPIEWDGIYGPKSYTAMINVIAKL